MKTNDDELDAGQKAYSESMQDTGSCLDGDLKTKVRPVPFSVEEEAIHKHGVCGDIDHENACSGLLVAVDECATPELRECGIGLEDGADSKANSEQSNERHGEDKICFDTAKRHKSSRVFRECRQTKSEDSTNSDPENNEASASYTNSGSQRDMDNLSSDVDNSFNSIKYINPGYYAVDKVGMDMIEADLVENNSYKRWYQHFFPRKKCTTKNLRAYIMRERNLAECRSRENEAVLSTSESVFFINKRRAPIRFDALHWLDGERDVFRTTFETFGKNFVILSRIVHRSIKECISYYYRTKRVCEYKKRIGRYSDDQLKLIVESEWSAAEIKMYKQCFRLYKGNIAKFANLFPNKDLEMFKRYYRKFHARTDQGREDGLLLSAGPDTSDENSSTPKRGNPTPPPAVPKSKTGRVQRHTKHSNITHTKKDSAEDAASILGEWTMDERQLFAIYYPHFNKNWIKFAECIKTKRIADFSKYFRFYFKKLSRNEKNFEAYQCELEKDAQRNLFVGRKRNAKTQDDVHLDAVGVLFQAHR